MWPLSIFVNPVVKSTFSAIFNHHGMFDVAHMLNGGTEVKNNMYKS